VRFHWAIRFETDRRPPDGAAGASPRTGARRLVYWIGIALAAVGFALIVLWKILGVIPT
jgi:hypothetical protein